MEELERHKLLAQFDYISSVSGGGYTSAALAEQTKQSGSTFFNKNTYPLQAPPYRLIKILAAFFIDAAISLALTLPLLGIALFFLVNGGEKDSDKISGLVYLLCGIGVVDSLQSLRPSARNQQAADNHLFRLRVLLGYVCFFTGAALVVNVGAVGTLAGVLALMYAGEKYVATYAHRFHRLPDPFFQWVFAALLGALSTMLWRVTAPLPYSGYVLWASVFISLLGPWNWSLSMQNKWNHTFQCYRATLRARFLPQTGDSLKLHTLGNTWAPYPIFNVSANLGPNLIAFELAPLRYGSDETGYLATVDHLPELDLATTMAISGGAVDFLKKTASLKSLLGIVLNSTSYWLSLHQKKSQYHFPIVDKFLTLAGAFPKNAILLSDGGFVENLGVLALIKRRVKVIVCLDAGYDPDFGFEDLRQLCTTVRTGGMGNLILPDIATATVQQRFHQNSSNVLVGTIVYPSTDDYITETGTYIHIKLSGTLHSVAKKSKHFPHLPTVDQQLTEDEISSLHLLGRELATELRNIQEFAAYFGATER